MHNTEALIELFEQALEAHENRLLFEMRSSTHELEFLFREALALKPEVD